MLTLEVVAEFSLCDVVTTCGNKVTSHRKNKLWKIELQATSYTKSFEKRKSVGNIQLFLFIQSNWSGWVGGRCPN